MAFQDVKTRNRNSKMISESWRNFLFPLSSLILANTLQLGLMERTHRHEPFKRSWPPSSTGWKNSVWQRSSVTVVCVPHKAVARSKQVYIEWMDATVLIVYLLE